MGNERKISLYVSIFSYLSISFHDFLTSLFEKNDFLRIIARILTVHCICMIDLTDFLLQIIDFREKIYNP